MALRLFLSGLCLTLLLTAAALQPAAQEASSLTEMPDLHEADELLATQPALPPPDESEDALRQILMQEKYIEGSARNLAQETWLEKFTGWLSRFMSRLGIHVDNDLSLLVIAALVLLLLVVIVRIIWGLQARRRDDIAEDGRSEDSRDLTPAGLRRAAAESAAAGDLRSAIRLRFLSVIAEARLPYSTLLTNSQLMRRVRASFPALLEPFGELVLAYEDAWYGGQQLSTEDYSRADRLASSMETTLGQVEK